MDSGYARNAPVSVDQTNQSRRGQTKGCPELLTTRRNSLRQRTRRRPSVSGGGAAWLRAQGERARLRAQMSRGKWASGVRALKGRGRAEVVGKRADVGASTTGVRGQEVRDGGSDGLGPRGSESGRAQKETAPTDLAHWVAGGREGGESARTG